MSSYAQHGSVRIAFELGGRRDGDRTAELPLLCIHGLGYERHGWGPGLARIAGEREVILLDNRGIGASDVPPGPYTVAQLAADAHAVLDAAGVERADVLGVSLGGMIAQELALTYPGSVGRLVLACTTPGVRGHAMPARTVRLFATIGGLEPATALRQLIENSLADSTVRRRPELIEEVYRYRIAHPPALPGWQAQAAAGATFDALDRLEAIRAPTLVLHGTDDHVIDVRNAELLARRIDGARVELVPDAGHLFFWEEPERFAASVLGFLAESP